MEKNQRKRGRNGLIDPAGEPSKEFSFFDENDPL